MLTLNDGGLEVSMAIGKMTVADIMEKLKDEEPGTLVEKTAIWRELSHNEAQEKVNEFVANVQYLITAAKDLSITHEPPLLQFAEALIDHETFIAKLHLGSAKTQPTVRIEESDGSTALKAILRTLCTTYAKANFILWATIWDDLSRLGILENVEREETAVKILSESTAQRRNRLAAERYQASKRGERTAQAVEG